MQNSALLPQVMKVLLLDNFDSFTYNLYHYLVTLGADVEVFRNDAISPNEAERFSHLVISPGPGLPKDAGVTMKLLETFGEKKPILGVCLGWQALAQHFGAELYNQNEVAHGIARAVQRSGQSWLLDGLPETFEVGLYHSWAVKNSAELERHFRLTASRSNQIIMSMEHRHLPLAGVQFHPESIMSKDGMKILENFLKYSAQKAAAP